MNCHNHVKIFYYLDFVSLSSIGRVVIVVVIITYSRVREKFSSSSIEGEVSDIYAIIVAIEILKHNVT